MDPTKLEYGKLLLLMCLIAATFYPQISFSHGNGNPLLHTLGSTANIVEHHTLAKTARLKVVSVTESHKHALKSADRIAGYPATTKLETLTKEKSQQLATLLLDKNNYANIRQRCENRYFHGIRFSKDQEKAEVALGVPCNQLLAVFRKGTEIKWWGGVLGNEAARQVLTLLEK